MTKLLTVRSRIGNPIHHDVDGAPLRIGTYVRVRQIIDESADKYFLGRVGTVQYFEYSCGSGQSYPNDPMIGVKFRKRIAEFWTEELEPASMKPRKSLL